MNAPATAPLATRLPVLVRTTATVAVLALAWVAAAWRPLWYDELFTYYVARQSSLLATLQALLAGADTNPPLDYLLRHVSMVMLGDTTAAFRLPSAIAFVAGLFAIYAYVKPRVPPAAAIAAFLTPIGTAAIFFSYEGRAYALLFASGALALLAWQRAVDNATPTRLALLVLALCVGPFSHYFGVLSLVPPAVGEVCRMLERRRLDTRVALAFVIAALVCLLLIPFAQNAVGMKGAFWAANFRLRDAYLYFPAFLHYGGSSVVGVLVAGLLAFGGLACSARWRAKLRLDAPAHEVVAAAVLAYVPLLAYALATVATGALTPRYAIGFVPGVAIFVGYLWGIVAAALPRSAWMAAFSIAVLGFGSLLADVRKLIGEAAFPAELQRVLETLPGPVAFDTPHKFLEYYHYAPESLRTRFVYPMDTAHATLRRGFGNDEIALRGLAQVVPLHVTGYVEFATRTPEFLLVRDYDFVPALTLQLRADRFCLDQVAQSGSVVVLRVSGRCRR